MIDPRTKGFISRLFPSLLLSAGVCFGLFTTMAFLIADQQPTQIIPETQQNISMQVKVRENLIEPLEEEKETVQKTLFVDAQNKPEIIGLPEVTDYKVAPALSFDSVKPLYLSITVPTIHLPELSQEPVLLTFNNPEYPFKARKAGVQGYVIVAMNVNTDGRVNDAWVVEAFPTGYFENQALRAAKNFKYSPRIENGKRVIATNLQYRWDFDLLETPKS